MSSDPADGKAHGHNPLCGDDVGVTVNFAEDVIDAIRFKGRGCAISQAATSMLTELVKGRTVSEIADLDKQVLLDELGVPLTPIRLKMCNSGPWRAEGCAP